MINYKLPAHGCLSLAAALLLTSPAFASPPSQPTFEIPSAVGAAKSNPIEEAVHNADRDSLQGFLEHGSPDVRTAAFEGLTAFDPDLSVRHITADFQNLASPTRLDSLRVLDQSLQIDSQTAINFLKQALHDEDGAIKEAALAALTRRSQDDNSIISPSDLSGPESEAKQLAKVHFASLNQDQAGLIDLMKIGSAGTQQAAFDALATTDAVEATHQLVHEFQDKTSPSRLRTLELLVRSPYTGRPALFDLLHSASNDEDQVVKAYASQILTDLKDEETAQPSGPNIIP